MEYYARRNEIDDRVRYQTVKAHIDGTTKYCSQFVGAFADPELGEILGKLHDLGKYTEPFQRRIRGEAVRTPHALAGALVSERLYAKNPNNYLYRLIGMAVCGHHAGLPNFDGSYAERIREKIDDAAYRAWRAEIPALPELALKFYGIGMRQPREAGEWHVKKLVGLQFQLLGRFLLSSLVDADRIDAQNFPDGDADRYMAKSDSLEALQGMLQHHMEKLAADAPKTALNDVRAQILADCLKAADGQRGIYSFTVPTGGGKTLASMSFALRHALKNGQRRVIYAIPFTSIIEQNAGIFAGIFGRNNVLEHHSNFAMPEEDTQKEAYERLRLAQENWHEPIVVTTNVQFFESLFSHRAGKVRKVHHIARSVIILDEVQSIPLPYVGVCMELLQELVQNYGCTVVLCTATQPEFDRNRLFLSNASVLEIIKDVPDLFVKLRRTTPEYLGPRTIEEVAACLREQPQALCIVNTKRHARELYQKVADCEGVYHLSTRLYPAHRKAALQEIRDRLKANLPCIVISTQLIEAGVDVDFPVVYRAAAGIDSIVQAAGRCNREGRRATGMVYVFEPEERYWGKGQLALAAQIGRTVVAKQADFLSVDAIRDYFHRLFDLNRDLFEQQKIWNICAKACEALPDLRIAYEEIDDAFRLIDSEEIAVVIEDGPEVTELLEQAKYATSLGGILRKLSAHAVSVRRYELQKLMERRAARCLNEGIFVLTDPYLYDPKCGLTLESDDSRDYII